MRPSCATPKSRRLAPQKISRRVSLCCFEMKGFNLTDSNWPSKIRQTSLLTAQIAFHLELGRFSHLQMRIYTGLLEELPTRASVDTPTPRNRDAQLLIHLKLKGEHVDLTEKTRLRCRVFTRLSTIHGPVRLQYSIYIINIGVCGTVARQRLRNEQTIQWPSLGNGSVKRHERNNFTEQEATKITGSDIFHAFRAETVKVKLS